MAGETELGVDHPEDDGRRGRRAVGDTRRVHVPADADAGRAYELLAPAAADGLLRHAGRHRRRQRVVAGTARHADVRGQDRRRRPGSSTGAAPAVDVVNQVRALSPHIGAVTELLGKRTIVWRAAAGRRTAPGGRAGAPGPAGRRRLGGRARAAAGGPRARGAAEFLRGAGRAPGEPMSRAARRGRPAALSPARAAAWHALLRCAPAAARSTNRWPPCPSSRGWTTATARSPTSSWSGTVKRRGSVDAVLAEFANAPLVAHRRARARGAEAGRLPAAVPGPRARLRRGRRRGRAGAPARQAHARIRERGAAAGGDRGRARFADLGGRRRRARLGGPLLVPRVAGQAAAARARRRGGGQRSWLPPSSLPSAACA